MADQSDIETVLAGLVARLVYPQGTDAPSVTGGLVRIYRGWPNQAALNADLAAGTVTVTIFPDPAQHRVTTRYIDPPIPQKPVSPTLSVAVSGVVATFSGTATLGQLAGLLVDNTAFVHRTAAGDTPELVASILASYIRTLRIAQVAGVKITVPGAGSLVGRIVADQATQTETRRQMQGFRLSCWCPDPATRDTVAGLIDEGLSAITFLALPDNNAARMRQTGTLVFDQSQNAGLYRRDLLVAVEYPTTIVTTLPSLIFGDSRLLANAAATGSLLG